MRKYQKWMRGCALAAGVLLLAACGEETPKEAVSTYIDDWQAGNYGQMYARLSEASKEKMSEEEFVERHEKIYKIISDLQVKATFPESFSGEEKEAIDVAVSMDTIAEPVSFSETLEVVLEEGNGEKEWKINWKPQYIFPELERDDKVKFDTTPATRGQIFAANGDPLAANGEMLSLGFKAGNEEEGSVERASEALALDEEYVAAQLEQDWVKKGAFVPLTKWLPEKEEEALKIAKDIPGLMFKRVNDRVYPLGEAAAHLTGYISEVTAEDLEKLDGEGYTNGSKIGKAGLEAVFESRLRGEDGVKIYTVGAGDEEKLTVSEKEMVPGEDISLTIDPQMQQAVYEQLKQDEGVGVAMHPETGETLALVSAPTYDPNKLAHGGSQAYVEAERRNAILNKFTQRFSPGSTFKPFTAAFALAEGTLDPNEAITVSGKEWQPEGADWGDYEVMRVSDYGEPVDLTRALVYSDNIYFAQQALALGEEKMKTHAEALGFGEPIPYGYGLQPSLLTGEEGFENDIQLADTGYGQGEVLMNPVHLATLYTAFVNDGNIIQPVLEQKEETSSVWKEAFPPEIAGLIDEALVKVVTDERGTAKGLQSDGLSLAAKTGTAELSGNQGEETDDTLGWLVAYDREPSNLVVALMQEGVESNTLIDKMRAIFADTH